MDTPNIELLRFQWSENLTSSIFKVLFLTVVFLIIFLLTFQFANFEEVIKNWSRYRCNPAFMPFASLAGYDAGENFQFCLNSAFGEKAKELFAPIFALIGNFVQILKLIVDVAMGLRQMFSNFFLSMNGFMRNVRDRIQALLFQVRLSFLKMQNLMSRVYATMFSVVFMGMSSITAGLNLSENSLVSFVLENGCFAPETLVLLDAGQKKPISEIQIGDILKGNKQVLSIFQFDGTPIPMVTLFGDQISSEHMVLGPDNSWIAAKDHPAATPSCGIPLLICLNVTGNRFELASGLHVCDYDESDSPQVVQKAQTIASQSLNSFIRDTFVSDYSLGVSPESEVLLDNQTWMPIASIQLGDILYGNNRVTGLVKERCSATGIWQEIECSAAQLVHVNGEWKRIANITECKPSEKVLHQLITRNVGPLVIRHPYTQKELWIRDYREAPVTEMEEVYQSELEGSICKMDHT